MKKKFIYIFLLLIGFILIVNQRSKAQISAPLNLAATSHEKSILLTWNKPLTNASSIKNYKVYWDEVSMSTKNVYQTISYNADDTTATISNLVNYKTYYFRVAAVDFADKEGTVSNEITAFAVDMIPSEIPKGLNITIGNQSLTLSWDNVADAAGDFKMYNVYSAVQPNNFTLLTSTKSNTYIVTGLTNNTSYYYRIASVDLAGNESKTSPIVKATPLNSETANNKFFRTASVLNKAVAGAFSPSNTVDHYYLTLQAGTKYKIFTSSLAINNPAIPDTKIEIFADPDTLNLIGNDVNSGANSYSSYTFTPSTSGKYYIRTSTSSVTLSGDYKLSVFAYQSDAFESNNSFASATKLTSDIFNGALSIHAVTDSDYFYFDTKINQTATCVIYSDSKGKISVFDENKKLLFSKLTGNMIDTVSVFARNAGKYYVKYESANGEPIYEYGIAVSIVSPLDLNVLQNKYVQGWKENFELPSFTKNWLILNYNGDQSSWNHANFEGADFSYALGISESTSGNNDWLISPVFDVSDSSSFAFVTKTSDTRYENFEIWVGSANATTSSDFTKLMTDSVLSKDFVPYSIELHAYKGQSIRLAIRNVSLNKGRQVIDNVAFIHTPFNNRLQGVVSDQVTGSALANVSVTLGSKVATSDATGNYKLEHLPVGLYNATYSKSGYQSANFNVDVMGGNIVTKNVKLIPLTSTTVYYSGFEAAQDTGISRNSVKNGWHIDSTFVYNGETVTASDGKRMCVFGGKNSYTTKAVTFWGNLSNTDLDLSSALSAQLSFKAKHNLEFKKDFVGLVGRNSLHTELVIPIPTDAQVTANGGFTGVSNTWKTYTVDITNYCGKQNGNNVEFGFAAVTDSVSNPFNWGFAFDELKITMQKNTPIASPTNLKASNYLQDVVKLTWVAASGAVKYNVYRADSTGVFRMVGSVTGISFDDTKVKNQVTYTYKVTALTDFGESNFALAPSTTAIAGKPAAIYIAKNRIATEESYYQNFDLLSTTLPSSWANNTDNEKYSWKIGNQLTSKTLAFNSLIYTDFLFISDKFPTIGDNKGNVLATSPWFDVSSLSTNLILSFKSFSQLGETEKHYVVMRTLDQTVSDWKTVDSMMNDDKVQRKNYIVTPSVKKLVQFGFRFVNTGEGDVTLTKGWAVDSFMVADKATGSIDGKILSSAGLPIFRAKVEIPELNLSTYTDTTGYYGFISNYSQNSGILPLYEGKSYQIKVTADMYKVKTFNTTTIKGNTVIHENTNLEIISPAIENIELSYSKEGFAMLDWKNHLSSNIYVYDNGKPDHSKAIFDGKKVRLLFKTDKSPLRFRKVHLLVGKDQIGTTIPSVNVFSKDLKTKLLGATNVKLEKLNDEGDYTWATLKIDFIANDQEFWVEFTFPDPFVIATNNTSRLYQESLDDMSVWGYDFYTLMARIQYDDGTLFTNKYNVFKGTNADNLTLLQGANSTNWFVDKTVTKGSNAYYAINAIYNTGVSNRSNIVHYALKALPFIDTSKTKGIDTIVDFNSSGFTKKIALLNSGVDTLHYKVDYFSGYLPNVIDQNRNFALAVDYWGRIKCYDKTPKAGDTATLSLYIENERDYEFWITKATIAFPAGINVISSTDFVENGTGNYLYTNNKTGNGATIEWNTPIGKGVLVNDHVSVARIKVKISADYTGDYSFAYTLTGDMPEYKANSLTGTFKFDTSPFNVSVSNNIGKVKANTTNLLDVSVAMNSKKSGFYPGYLRITSDAVNEPVLYVPFRIEIAKSFFALKGNVTNVQTGLPLAYVGLMVQDTIDENNYDYLFTDNNGNYSSSSLKSGVYRVTANVNDYVKQIQILTIDDSGLDKVLNFSMIPDIRTPLKLTAKDDVNKITVRWVQRTVDATSSMSGTNDAPIGSPWIVVDNNNDANTWKYYNDGSFSAAVCYSNPTQANDDWLISPALQVTKNSHFTFSATAPDWTHYREKFVVRVSTKSPNIADFETQVYSYEFQYYGPMIDFDIPLGQFADNENIWVAIQCISDKQSILAVKRMFFSHLLSKPTGLNLPYTSQNALNKFVVYRSEDNANYYPIDTIPGNSIGYYDTKFDAGRNYWYRVKSFYTLGSSTFSDSARVKVNNFAPIIGKFSNFAIDEDTQAKLLLSYTDNNGLNNLIIKTESVIKKFNFTISKDNIIVAPFKDWNGSSKMSIIVSDGFLTDTTSFIITVNPINDAPVIASSPDLIAKTSALYVYKLNYYDVDNANLSVTTNLPSWLKYSQTDRTISGTPTVQNIGKHSVTITVSDGLLTVNQTFEINVVMGNEAPVFTSQAVTSVQAGKEYIYQIVATDLNNDNLRFEATSIPTWLTLETSSENGKATLKGTVPAFAVDANIIISVTDNYNTLVQQKFTIAIIPLTGFDNQVIDEVLAYPNPSNGRFMVRNLPANRNGLSYRVVDAIGRVVLKSEMISSDNLIIDLQNTGSGTYFLEFIQNNKKLKVLQLIVK